MRTSCPLELKQIVNLLSGILILIFHRYPMDSDIIKLVLLYLNVQPQGQLIKDLGHNYIYSSDINIQTLLVTIKGILTGKMHFYTA